MQLLPFQAAQRTALYFAALNFADVAYETVDKLQVRHFEREHRHRNVEAYSHAHCHRQHKGCFTHCRTGGNNHEVAVLPTRSHAVDFVEAGLKAAQAVGAVCRIFNFLESVDDYRLDFRHIFLEVALREFKQFAFGFLQNVEDVD